MKLGPFTLCYINFRSFSEKISKSNDLLRNKGKENFLNPTMAHIATI